MNAAKVDSREFAAILASLSEPLPENVIRRRVGWRDSNGAEHWVDYIDWHTAADALDRICPDWSHEIRDITVVGSLVAVTAAITIKGVTRCGIGVGSTFDEKGIKGAEHDALKRAAVKFGLARSLYSRGTSKPTAPAPTEVKAHDGPERVTDKQLAAIYAIAKAKSLDAQLESLALFRCEPEKLSRADASTLIDHLRNVRISA
ncbi:MAG TPA: Rad52/Rad22 family DNA repair protein [Blastocatellia bacterium]|nr:Rad52/Rad22 family DNA repair protein [Blastocatellia bacterium]